MDFQTTDDEFDLEYIRHSESEDLVEEVKAKPVVIKKTRGTTSRRKKEVSLFNQFHTYSIY